MNGLKPKKKSSRLWASGPGKQKREERKRCCSSATRHYVNTCKIVVKQIEEGSDLAVMPSGQSWEDYDEHDWRVDGPLASYV